MLFWESARSGEWGIGGWDEFVFQKTMRKVKIDKNCLSRTCLIYVSYDSKSMIPMRQSTGGIHHLCTSLGSVSQPCMSGAHCRAQALRMSERCTDIHRLQLVSFPCASKKGLESKRLAVFHRLCCVYCPNTSPAWQAGRKSFESFSYESFWHIGIIYWLSQINSDIWMLLQWLQYLFALVHVIGIFESSIEVAPRQEPREQRICCVLAASSVSECWLSEAIEIGIQGLSAKPPTCCGTTFTIFHNLISLILLFSDPFLGLVTLLVEFWGEHVQTCGPSLQGICMPAWRGRRSQDEVFYQY